MTLVRDLRRAASHAKHQLFPTPEVAAWRHACRVAAEQPRHTPGEIDLNGYRIAYADLLTLCPQWHDIFVRGSLRFTSATPTPRVLDCGANIGLASLNFKRQYPGARITAFEADPDLASLCRGNLAANDGGDVAVETAAVWRQAGVVRFQREGADSGAIEGTSEGLVGAVVDVRALRLRDLLEAEPIDLLKLDIEGAEAAVIEDCAASFANVRAIVMDLHEFDADARHTPEIMRILRAAGFRISMSDLTPLPWRAPAGNRSPFPEDCGVWAVTLRAWRV